MTLLKLIHVFKRLLKKSDRSSAPPERYVSVMIARDLHWRFLMIQIWTRPLIGAQSLWMGQFMARSPAFAQLLMV